jgi:hypothetical protein
MGGKNTEMKTIFRKNDTKFVVLDENCHWLKLMYLFLETPLYTYNVKV